jgi:hypothetical protein
VYPVRITSGDTPFIRIAGICSNLLLTFFGGIQNPPKKFDSHCEDKDLSEIEEEEGTKPKRTMNVDIQNADNADSDYHYSESGVDHLNTFIENEAHDLAATATIP